MSGWLDAVQQVWDSLTPDRQRCHRGNLDPWAGPVDPVEYTRWNKRHRDGVTTWRALREQPTCGCWMLDCADCMARVSNGERPDKGQRHRFVVDMSVNRVTVLGLLRRAA